MRPITIPLMLVAQLCASQSFAADAQAMRKAEVGLGCNDGGPGFLVSANGLRDRSGRMILELYPATQADFLKSSDALLRERKLFRRVEAPIPAQGAATLCIRAPKPGPYALVFIHDRDGKDKFNIWQDGVGLPSDKILGSARPRVTEATVMAGDAPSLISVRLQYIRGLSGFAPRQP